MMWMTKKDKMENELRIGHVEFRHDAVTVDVDFRLFVPIHRADVLHPLRDRYVLIHSVSSFFHSMPRRSGRRRRKIQCHNTPFLSYDSIPVLKVQCFLCDLYNKHIMGFRARRGPRFARTARGGRQAARCAPRPAGGRLSPASAPAKGPFRGRFPPERRKKIPKNRDVSNYIKCIRQILYENVT